MMYLAKILPGKEPIVTEVTEAEGFITPSGTVGVRQRRAKAWPLRNGGAAALSQSPLGAVASARCVLMQTAEERALRTRRDRP